MTVPIVDRFRRPEYTGENRCLPCTILNVAIAVVVSTVVAAITPVAPVVAAGVVLVTALLAIYLRGYLVPGTPTLTERYLPDRVHEALGTHVESADEQNWETLEKLERHRENRVEPAAFLADAGVVHEGEGGTELAPEFRTRLSERVAELEKTGVDQETLADVYGAEVADVEPMDDDHPAYQVGRHIRRWPSEAAFHTHVAADRVLREWADGWADVPVEQRQQMLESLRSLLQTCPSCGGDAVQSTERVESCCYGGDLHTVYCEDCGARLHEFDPNTAILSRKTAT